MQTADSERFEAAFAKLCAAFEVPATKRRKDAYWEGLRKMPIQRFERCVEIALDDGGPEIFPTYKALRRLLGRSSGSGAAVHTSAQPKDPDHLEYFANRLLWMHLSHREGLGSQAGSPSAELEACRKFKRELVQEFTGYISQGDEDATPAAFYQFWLSGLRRISVVQKRTINALNLAMEHPDAQKPFDQAMVRPLQAQLEAA